MTNARGYNSKSKRPGTACVVPGAYKGNKVPSQRLSTAERIKFKALWEKLSPAEKEGWGLNFDTFVKETK